MSLAAYNTIMRSSSSKRLEALKGVRLLRQEVEKRIMGGHNVPDKIVLRRYHTGIRNFFQLYQALTESWRFYDNSDPAGPRVIAAGHGKEIQIVENIKTWNIISGKDKE